MKFNDRFQGILGIKFLEVKNIIRKNLPVLYGAVMNAHNYQVNTNRYLD